MRKNNCVTSPWRLQLIGAHSNIKLSDSLDWKLNKVFIGQHTSDPTKDKTDSIDKDGGGGGYTISPPDEGKDGYSYGTSDKCATYNDLSECDYFQPGNLGSIKSGFIYLVPVGVNGKSCPTKSQIESMVNKDITKILPGFPFQDEGRGYHDNQLVPLNNVCISATFSQSSSDSGTVTVYVTNTVSKNTVTVRLSRSVPFDLTWDAYGTIKESDSGIGNVWYSGTRTLSSGNTQDSVTAPSNVTNVGGGLIVKSGYSRTVNGVTYKLVNT